MRIVIGSEHITVDGEVFQSRKGVAEFIRVLRGASLVVWPSKSPDERRTAAKRGPEPEPQMFCVEFLDLGDKKIEVIRVIRAHLGLALKEAKDASESAPGAILLRTKDLSKANLFARDLTHMGAQVSVKLAP
jgi:ribosomal protein L7/L12